MYEISKTTNFRFQYNKLNLRYKRNIEDAIEYIKESPTEGQGKITQIANKKEGGLYRYRLPGCYIFYILPEHEEGEATIITMTAIKLLR